MMERRASQRAKSGRTFLILVATQLIVLLLLICGNQKLDPGFGSEAVPCDSPKLAILVLTYDRWMSLQRLLHSLQRAQYGCAPIHLTVSVENGDSETLQHARSETYKIAMEFRWEHGPKFVLRRVRRAGLRRQWMESFHSLSDTDYIAIFEDDMEVSTQFYAYISMLHKKGKHIINAPNVSTICLHPLSGKGILDCHDKSNSHHLFLSSFICSWGPVWKAREWMQMINLVARLEELNTEPFLPVGAPNHELFNTWLQKGRDLQSPYVARYMYQEGFSTLVYDITTVRAFLDNDRTYDLKANANSCVRSATRHPLRMILSFLLSITRRSAKIMFRR